jgi:6-pyruvoyltetrahydropterin/6-carboxytetrahydropterin synthase
MFISTKLYKEIGPVAYRQWRADSDCKYLHGYALSFYFEFEAVDLDARNWVVDFGGLKPLKDKLEEWFDHTTLVATDDPEFETFVELRNKKMIKMVEVERTGCEGLADFVYNYMNEIFMPEQGYGDRVWCRKVVVSETEKNSAGYEGSRCVKGYVHGT